MNRTLCIYSIMRWFIWIIWDRLVNWHFKLCSVATSSFFNVKKKTVCSFYQKMTLRSVSWSERMRAYDVVFISRVPDWSDWGYWPRSSMTNLSWRALNASFFWANTERNVQVPQQIFAAIIQDRTCGEYERCRAIQQLSSISSSSSSSISLSVKEDWIGSVFLKVQKPKS